MTALRFACWECGQVWQAWPHLSRGVYLRTIGGSDESCRHEGVLCAVPDERVVVEVAAKVVL